MLNGVSHERRHRGDLPQVLRVPRTEERIGLVAARSRRSRQRLQASVGGGGGAAPQSDGNGMGWSDHATAGRRIAHHRALGRDGIMTRLTKEQAAIIGAYTGILCGPFDEMHQYIEGLMGRPVFTCELGSKGTWEMIKELAKADLGRIVRELGE